MEVPQEKIDHILERLSEELEQSRKGTPESYSHTFRAAGHMEALKWFGMLPDELSHLISTGKWKKPKRVVEVQEVE